MDKTYFPYPRQRIAKVIGFQYESDLWVMRRVQAVQRRSGKDALYIVARPLEAKVRIKAMTHPNNAGWVEYDFPITVPQGFKTDFASVPSLLRFAVSRVGPHLEACVIHDWLYQAWKHHGCQPNSIHRKFADNVLMAGMKQAKVRPIRRLLIYSAVRLFGSFPFYR